MLAKLMGRFSNLWPLQRCSAELQRGVEQSIQRSQLVDEGGSRDTRGTAKLRQLGRYRRRRQRRTGTGGTGERRVFGDDQYTTFVHGRALLLPSLLFIATTPSPFVLDCHGNGGDSSSQPY
ncbi:hypothetical protein PIB30_009138 [Stylosanthes scabra]|uniref:Uncharacterized protein n=1 Tax=Stylosanthes scabra TaxID=79078 RepID=A0ABU6X5T8_9FABA|nr:hypothetical protein [Stylosanthes scabra]